MKEQELIGLMLLEGMLGYFEITKSERSTDTDTPHLAFRGGIRQVFKRIFTRDQLDHAED